MKGNLKFLCCGVTVKGTFCVKLPFSRGESIPTSLTKPKTGQNLLEMVHQSV